MQPSKKSQPSISPKKAKIELSRRHLRDFIAYIKHDYIFNWHHERVCDKLEAFGRREINKLMVFMPPQHGKSELTTRKFPAYLLGIRPETKICVCSYSATLAQSFNRDIQRVIDDAPYHEVFPNTILSESNVTTNAHGNYLRNADIFETVGYRGFVKTVGVGGSLVGTPIDVGIIDDPFKDREEAMSIRIRDKVWSWYTDVFKTRLHNTSQELIILTRWDADDLAGRILKVENDWDVVSFQAIKERDTPGDPRQIGEALWPEKHSLERILAIKETSPFTFSSLYQQEPKPSTEALVFPEWDIYEDEPDIVPIYGLDFGFSNDPTGLIQVKIHKENMYLKELLYRKGLTTPDLDIAMQTLIPKHSRISADSADPRTIADLNKRGWRNITPSIKGPDSIVNGINWMKGFKLHVHKDSHNLKNELLNYQWVMYGGKATNMAVGPNHCFIGSTMVSTSEGERRIDSIKDGDLVATSKGYRPVLKKWCNGKKQTSKYLIQFNTFLLTLICTPDHLVKTNKGWTEISKLESGMTVSLIKHSTGSAITSMPEPDILHAGHSTCIGPSGSTTTARGQKDFMSIIRIITLGITESITLNLSLLKFIYQSILKNGLKKTLSGLRHSRQKVLSWLKSGIEAVRVSSGIDSTLSIATLEMKHMERGLAFAEPCLLPRLSRKGSVQTNASHNQEDYQELITSKDNASIAARLSSSISISKQRIAKITKTNSGELYVYDLTVEDDHEYFANGLLVHNCMDAIRYVKSIQKTTSTGLNLTFSR